MPIQDELLDVLVVGSGIGGLTAAALLQQQGFRVAVFEKNRFPGGVVRHSAVRDIPLMLEHLSFTGLPGMGKAAP